jgi:hypothetical protein
MSNRLRDPALEGAMASPGALRLAQVPSVAISEAGVTLQPVIRDGCTSEDFRAAFLTAFGTTELVIAEALFEQILNVVHTEPAKPLDDATANLVLGLTVEQHLTHLRRPAAARRALRQGHARGAQRPRIPASASKRGYRAVETCQDRPEALFCRSTVTRRPNSPGTLLWLDTPSPNWSTKVSTISAFQMRP